MYRMFYEFPDLTNRIYPGVYGSACRSALAVRTHRFAAGRASALR